MPFEIEIRNQEQYPLILLKDVESETHAEVYAYGGLLNVFAVKTNNGFHNAIDGFSSVADAVENITAGFKSAKLSPFTCRMHLGSYQFQQQAFRINKFYLGQHAIHGIIYDGVYSIQHTEANEQHALVVLQFAYDGSDKGYPFPYSVLVEWKLEAGNKLSVKSSVEHQNDFPIPYAEGWHPYFNMDVPVDECTLQMDSSILLEFDETLIPTGKLIDVHDYRQAKSLNGISLDNCFLLDPLVDKPRCILAGKHLELVIETNHSYSYLQIYTPEHRNSIAIENLSAAPDAFNNGLGLQLLQPNKVYTFETSYILRKTP